MAVEAPEGEAFEVNGSRGQLARVVGNLLDNAQRHAGTSVAVSVAADGRGVRVEVRDDGDGVPEEERERIFERFVRLDDARSRTTAAPVSASPSPGTSPPATAGR